MKVVDWALGGIWWFTYSSHDKIVLTEHPSEPQTLSHTNSKYFVLWRRGV